MKAETGTLDKLAYFRLLDELGERTSTALGRELAGSLLPDLPDAEISAAWNRTEEILSGADLSLGGIRDIRPLLNRINEGELLEGAELLEIAWTMDAAGSVRRALAGDEERPALAAVASHMGSFDGALRLVREQLDNDGRVRDDATPKLREIRRRLNPLRSRIRERLQDIMERRSEAIQDPFITQRRDRYVIPVRASFQSQVPGIVLDSSDSGATVFVEPQQVIGMNNELALLELEERDEVRRILISLGQRLASEPQLEATLSALGLLDLSQASARLARDWRLVRPEFSEDAIKLDGLRHPFVENCVPNSLGLDRQLRLLIVTGPNAGGKTVLLKSLGLAALMASSGLFVATEPGSVPRLPRFRKLLVDIGDEQSIEASLSTYAAHLVNLKRIVLEAAPDVLVLIDELGSGTDPAEGAALSQAILEEVLRRGALGLVTTHLAPLKVFANEHDFVLNAAMRFDVDRLMPTFELVPGQPGRSYALAIAERLGLPADLLERAGEILGPEGERLESLLVTLERQREQLEEQLADAAREREQALEEAELLREQITALRRSEQELLADAARRADEMLKRTMQQASELRRTASSSPEKRGSAMQQIQQLREEARRQGNLPRRRSKAAPRQSSKTLRPGQEVYVASYDAAGQLLELRGDQAVVQLGLLKVNVPTADLKVRERKQPQRRESHAVGSTAFSEELNIRGERVEEGLEQLEDFLNEAYALKVGTVRILHGKGTGALRDAVRRYLKDDRRVADFSDAAPYDGGHGVTVASLKV